MQGYAAAAADDEAPDHKIDLALSEEDSHEFLSALTSEFPCKDEAGPFQTVPYPGSSWRPQGRPALQPHEYVRAGTSKVLTLFEPATGQVHLRPVTRSTNPVLHGWLQESLDAIIAALPTQATPTEPMTNRAAWQVWQAGLAARFTLPAQLPPLRVAGMGQSRRA